MAVFNPIYIFSVDLTKDTVTEEKMLKGTTAHDKNGVPITGNIQVYDGSYECA